MSFNEETFCKYCQKTFKKNFYQKHHQVLNHFDDRENDYFLELDRELKRQRDLKLRENLQILTILKYYSREENFERLKLPTKLSIVEKTYKLW